MKAEQFVVGRLAINCCSADAAPYGILANYDQGKTLANNQWVRITGVVGKSKFKGNDVLTLNVVESVKVPEPKQQYVYPNFEFLK